MLSFLIEAGAGHAQGGHLQFTGPDGHQGIAGNEAAVDIRAAGNGIELYVLLDMLIDEVEACLLEGGARLGDAPKGGQVVVVRRVIAFLHQQMDIAGGEAKEGNLFLLQDPPDPAQVRMGHIAVIEGQHTAAGQGAQLPVPHHPAAGGDVHHRFMGPDVVLKDDLLHLVQYKAAMGVDHALGFARGTGGEHDEQGRISADLSKLKMLRSGAVNKVIPTDAVFNVMDAAVVTIVMGNDHLFRLHLGLDQSSLVHHVEDLALIGIAVGGEEDLGMQLGKPVCCGIGADVRGAGAPGSAHCHRGQHGHDGFGNVGHIACHQVAFSHADLAQLGCQAGHLGIQFPAADDTAVVGLISENDGGSVSIVPFQQVFRVIEPGSREPLGAGHFVAILQNTGIGFGGDHMEILPAGAPEFFRFFHGPPVKGGVVRKGLTHPVSGKFHEIPDVGILFFFL